MTITFNPPVQPHEGSKSKPELKLLKAEFGDGYSQTTRDGMNHVRHVFNALWEKTSDANADTIIAFLEARGGDEPFLYTIPGSATPIRWTCEEWERTHYGASISGVSAVFRQTFNLND